MLLLLVIHFVTLLVRLLRPDGMMAIVAENLPLKKQLLVIQHTRGKSPNLSSLYRFTLGWLTMLLSHQLTRVRERAMRRFKSMRQTRRFLSAHAAVYNMFNLGRHLVSAKNYRIFKEDAFASCKCSTSV